MDLEDLEARVFRLQQAKAVRQAVSRLPPRERVVIIARFGLDDGPPRTLDETGREIGAALGHAPTRERVRQIECKALRRLARPAAGLHEVAGLKKTFNAAEFVAHQQVLKAAREAAEQWRAKQRAAAEREAEECAAQRALAAEQWQAQQAARARQAAEAYAAQQRAKRQRFADQSAASVRVLPATPQQLPSMHYDWMQSMAELERWRASGRPVNPFDWTRWMES